MTDIPALPAAATTVGRSRAAVLAGVLPIISVIAVDPWGLAPHGPLRWTAVTATLLLAVAAARGPARLPRPMVVAWLVLLLAMGVATVGALDPVHAVIGTPDRRLGLLAWIGMAAAFAAGATITSDPDRRFVLRCSTIAGCLLAVGAGAEVVGWLPDSGFTRRLGGAYGQPAYLAAMATLLVPLSVSSAADAGERVVWRLIALASAIGATGALLASGTRGAWLGMAAGALPLLVRVASTLRRRATRVASGRNGEGHLVADRRPLASAVGHSLTVGGAVDTRTRRRRAIAALAVTALLTAGLLLTGALPRAVSGLDTSQGTAAGRLAEWAVAGRVIADRPVLGTGPEGYRIAFPAAVDAAYGRTYGREVHPDRAHNSILDVTATGGVAAGAAWVVLLGGVLLLGWRATRTDDPMLIGAGVAVIAYTAQQQLLFPLAEIDPVWWLLTGVLAGASPSAGVRWGLGPGTAPSGRLSWVVGQASGSSGRPPMWALARAPWPVPIPRPVRLVAVLLVGVTVVAGALGIVADRRMAAAAALAQPPTSQAALARADSATALRPDDMRLWFAASRIALRGDRIVDVDTALERIGRGLRISPRDPALLAEQASLLLDRARRSGLPDDLAAAIDAHRALVSADPANAAPRIGLATAFAYDGQLDRAEEAMAAAERLDPDAPTLPALQALLAVLAGDVDITTPSRRGS